MKLLTFLALVFAMPACSDSDENSTEQPIECGTLTQAECLDEPKCTPFFGTKIDVTVGCLGPLEMLICGDPIYTGDNNVPSGYVVGPEGTCWYQDSAYFGDIEGFQTRSDVPNDCATVTGACQPVDCAAMVETDCLGHPLCEPFYGNKIDETAMCFGPSEMIVCGNAATAECNNSIVGYVTDPDGTCWYQGDACFGPIPGYQGGSDFDGGDCPMVSEPCP